MRVAVEILETGTDEQGRPSVVGWRTDCLASRYWAGRRWGELVARGQTARLVDRRGTVLPL